ncbi:hypothetical protein C9925_00140 [cyanobacterium G8-9]|nr:hypothetical protein C9925_00140 [cyanobacterium G8-9]
MSIFKRSKAVLAFTFLITSFLSASVETHRFDVEQGFVLYEILGGAQLTEETNLNIHGTSKLRFKKWGTILQEEDSGIVEIKGAINYVQEIKRLEKYTKDKIITVDYKNEQLLERKTDKIFSNQEKETEGLVHRGQAVVAGVLCTVWVGPSIKKCIYKGVVLKQESNVLGVSYIKEATKAIFDINITDEECVLPDYPKQVFGLFTDNIKTKNKTKSENVCKIFKDVVNEVDAENKSYEPSKSIDRKKRQKFINKIAQDIFDIQKKILPELLMAMKKSRECLQLSENYFESNQCIETYTHQKKTLGFQDEDYVVFGTEKEKEKLLDKVEDAIIDLQSRIPCIKRSQNFIDISACMK